MHSNVVLTRRKLSIIGVDDAANEPSVFQRSDGLVLIIGLVLHIPDTGAYPISHICPVIRASDEGDHSLPRIFASLSSIQIILVDLPIDDSTICLYVIDIETAIRPLS